MAVLLVIVLLITGTYAPNALTQGEIDATVSSHQLGFANLFSPENIIGLPFKLFQKLSVALLGLSTFSIKLPSLIITAISAICFFVLISIWTDRRSAILSTLIVLISGRWLFLSQLGDQSASTIAWAVILMAVLAYLTHQANTIYQNRKRKNFKTPKAKLILSLLAIFLSASMLAYFTMGIYLIFIICLTMLLHPFIRLSLKRLNDLIGRYWYIVGLSCFVVAITPLAIGIFKDGRLATTLLSVNDFNFDIVGNIKFIIKEFLDFSPEKNSFFATPWFNLSSVVLVVIGVFREARTSYKPRSSIIIMWLMTSLVLSLFSQQTSMILFVPLALSLTMGLDYIINSWYRIFPRNPVARFVGLIPIVTLLACLMFYNLSAYVDAYIYQPGLANSFNYDLNILQKQLVKMEGQEVTIIASHQNNEYNFYEILSLQNPNIKISAHFDNTLATTQIATQTSRDSVNDIDIQQILTSHLSENADRFYVYKKVEK